MGYQKVTGSTVGLSSAMKSCMRPATVPMKTMKKRDHKAHAGQCNCDLNHPKSIDDNFLMPGELLQAPPNRNSASLKPNAAP
jgi:hypothetical protein